VGLRILLVDDEPLILRSMAQVLRLEGYEAIAASTPAEALALATASLATASAEPMPWFDLLITDILMPKMSGHVLAREVRLLVPSLVTLFISGSPVEPSDSSEYRQPTDAVLLKPFGLADLLGEVCRLIGPGNRSAGLDSAGLDSRGLDSAGLDSAGLDSAGLDSRGLAPPAPPSSQQNFRSR